MQFKMQHLEVTWIVNPSNSYLPASSPAGARGWCTSTPWPRSGPRARSRWWTSSWCAPPSSSPSRGSPSPPPRTRRTSLSLSPLRSRTLSGDAAPPAVGNEHEGEELIELMMEHLAALYSWALTPSICSFSSIPFKLSPHSAYLL